MGVEEYEWTISEWIFAEEDMIVGDMDFLLHMDALFSATSSGTLPRPTRNPTASQRISSTSPDTGFDCAVALIL